MSARLPDAELRERLAASSVAIIGCGGLGSNIAMMLLRTGVRKLTLIDFDRVTTENLNRQLFFADQVGELKTEALSDTLRRIDERAELRLISERMDAENLVEAVEAVDIIVEAVDAADTKAMIINACTTRLPAVPLVTASGLAGYDSVNLIRSEQLADNLYVVGDLSSDIREGHSLLATRVVAAAAHQAHAVVRLLLDCEEI